VGGGGPAPDVPQHARAYGRTTPNAVGPTSLGLLGAVDRTTEIVEYSGHRVGLKEGGRAEQP